MFLDRFAEVLHGRGKSLVSEKGDWPRAEASW